MVWPTVQTGLNCSAGALLRFLLNRFQLRTLKQIVNAFTFRRGKKELLLTMLVPLPWRLLHVHSLSRTGRTAYFLYSWSSTATFLLLVWMTFADFSTESRGQWAALWATSPLLSCCCCCCSTKWNSFAILGRAHVHGTHTQTHTILLLLLLSRRVADLQERKKSLSGSSEEFSGRRNQKELLAPTHGRTENYSMHTEN